MSVAERDFQLEYQRDFSLIERLLQNIERGKGTTGVSGVEARLYLSSCRNHYFSVNAVFHDAKLVLADAPGRSLLKLLRDATVTRDGDLFYQSKQQFGSIRRAAREKVAVWYRAIEIDSAVRLAIDSTFATFDKQRINEVVFGSTSDLNMDRVSRVALAVSPVEIACLNEHWKFLTDLFERLDELADFYNHAFEYRILASKNELFPDPSSLADHWESVVESATQGLGKLCKVSESSGGKKLLFQSGNAIRFSPDRQDMNALTDTLLEISEWEDEMKTRWIELFKPNTASREFPEVFEIRLPLESDSSVVRKPLAPRFKKIQLSADFRDNLRIACPGFGIPLSWYQQDVRIYREKFLPDVKNLIKEMFDAICGFNRQSGDDAAIRVVVFPEYFVPRSFRESLNELGRIAGVAVIYGLEAAWGDGQTGKIKNQAVVDFSAFEGELPMLLSGNSYECDKQFKSIFEPDVDSVPVVYIFESTPIGTFAVTICSDMTEYVVTQAIRDSGCAFLGLFLLAMNPSPDDFDYLIRTDCVRLHAPILVVNNCVELKNGERSSVSGTALFEPRKVKPPPDSDVSHGSVLGSEYSGCVKNEEPSARLPIGDKEMGREVFVYEMDQSFQEDVLCDERRTGHTYVPHSARVGRNVK